MGVHAGKIQIELPSTTIPKGSTLQVFGSGNVLSLTGNAEGGEIVYSHVKA